MASFNILFVIVVFTCAVQALTSKNDQLEDNQSIQNNDYQDALSFPETHCYWSCHNYNRCVDRHGRVLSTCIKQRICGYYCGGKRIAKDEDEMKSDHHQSSYPAPHGRPSYFTTACKFHCWWHYPCAKLGGFDDCKPIMRCAWSCPGHKLYYVNH